MSFLDYENSCIQSLLRGLSVIRSFRPGKDRLTIAEVATACDFTRAGARRLLLTLQDLGYVAHNGRHFFLTSRVLDLSQGFLQQSLWEATRPALQGIVDRLNEPAMASVLEGFDVLYVLRIRPPRPLHLEPQRDFIEPPHTSSIGRVLLASLTPGDLRRYLSRAKFTRLTPDTICDPETIRERLEEVRERGWSHVAGEVDEGVSGVAVPVKDAEGQTIAGLSIGTTPARASPEYVEETIVPVLQHAARTITQAL